MMKIAIYGAGSMGTVLGAFLCRAGYRVDLISRDREHIEALKTTGTKITGEISLSTPPFDGLEDMGLAMLPYEVSDNGTVIKKHVPIPFSDATEIVQPW